MPSQNHPLSLESSQRRYDEECRQGKVIAAGHERAWGWTGAAGAVRALRRVDFLVEKAGLAPGVRCLELGCGTGEFTSRLINSGCKVAAVEISEVTAALCQKRVGNRAEIIVGNIETGEGLENQHFDAVVGISVLHHLNLELCFKTMNRVLKKGGRFAFTEPNMANPQIWAERHIGWVKKIRHVNAHETAFFVGELRQKFSAGGFFVESCEPFEFLHPATPGWMIPGVVQLESILSRTPLVAIAGSIRIHGYRV